MKKNLILMVCLCLSTLVFAGPGLKLTAENRTGSSDEAALSTIYINDNQMVMKTEQNGDFTMMFDATKEEIIIVDHKKRQYSKMGKTELTELSNQLEQMKGIIKTFYKNMPAETQKKFAPLVNGKDQNITFNSKGTDKVNGWNTTKYEVAGGDNKTLYDLNIAEFSTLGIEKSDVAAIRKLSLMLEKYLSGIESFIPGASIFSNLNNDNNPMFTKGIPVKTVSYEANGSVGDQFVVTKAEKSDFDLDDFTIPSKYKEVKINLENPMQK
ncbi:MAG: hypothetical protein WBA74_13775 [Cyclobacteriaceae bacterium]